MRQVMESLNQSADLDQEKLSAIRAMIADHPVMDLWQIENLLKK